MQNNRIPPSLNPRGESPRQAPHFQLTPKGDSSLQQSVESIWNSILNKIQQTDQPEHMFSLPYSQGLLFGELLESHLKVSGTRADKNGKFTIFFDDSLDSNHSEENTSTPSASNLKERIATVPFMESPDYLRKFLEISEQMLNCINLQHTLITVSAFGFDREFFKSALLYHYPNTVQSVASIQKQFAPGLLRVSLLNQASSEEVDRKIQRLKKLVALVEKATISHYQSPEELSELPVFPSRRKGSDTPSDSFNSHLKKTSHSDPGDLLKTHLLETSSPPLLRRGKAAPLNRIGSSFSDPNDPLTRFFPKKMNANFRLDAYLESEDQNKDVNRVMEMLTECVETDLQGALPLFNSQQWKDLWHSIQNSNKLQLFQSKIWNLLSLKCRLKKASFDLIDYLKEDHALGHISKAAQIGEVPEFEIWRRIYPETALEPAVNIRVNNRCLESTKSEWSKAYVLSYFRVLLQEMIAGQYRSTEMAEELLNDVFDISDCDSHDHHLYDNLIVSLLKTVTFGFGGNSWWVLHSRLIPFLGKGNYKVSLTKDYKQTCEFFTHPEKENAAILTAAYTLCKNEGGHQKEKGRFITKLISSYSIARKAWSFSMEIPFFHPSSCCSLFEQIEIHKQLLSIARPTEDKRV